MSERTREEILEDLAAKMRRRAPVQASGASATTPKNTHTTTTTTITADTAPSETKICSFCGNEFTPGKNPKHKYCSTTCNTKAQNQKQKQRRDNAPPDPDNPRPKDKLVRVKCQNPNCPNGGVFETTEELYKKMKKYCDENCRKEAHRLKYTLPPKPKPEKPVSLADEIAKQKHSDPPGDPVSTTLDIQTDSETQSQSQPKPKQEQVVEIDYEPHSGGQRLVHESQARFKVLICGARWGKDRCLINEFIVKFAQMLSEQDRPTTLIPRVHGWLVAPTFPLAKQMWRELVHFWPRQWRVNKNEAEHRLETVGGGIIEVKSADNPDSLVSVGLDALLMTEAARVKDMETTWSYLRGRLSSPGRGPHGTGGIAMINSTPKGRNYLYQMFQWGLDERFPEWESFQFPTSSNPYIHPKEIEEAQRTLPERLFRQEFLGEFLEDSGEVFANIDDISTGVTQEPEPGRVYKAAWDPAQRNDYSAFGIRDDRGVQVLRERWTGLPWTIQLNKVEAYCKLYNNAHLDMDSTGLGETLPEAVAQRGISVTGHFFTNAFKEQMVSHFSLLCEGRDVILINDKPQKEELKAYTYSFTKTGKVSFHHPVGGNDDLVTMLLLLYRDYNALTSTLPYIGLLLGSNVGTPRNKLPLAAGSGKY